jgi:aminoglycoside phosphotransferase (APT) family kinase protein
VEAEWFAPVARNRAEVAWLRIAGDVVPGAVPRILGEDETAMAFAMEWLEPQVYPVWKSLLRDGIAGAGTARAVGSALAAIHVATADDDLARTFAHDAVCAAARALPRSECARASAARRGAARPCRHHGAKARAGARRRQPQEHPGRAIGPGVPDAECAWYGDPAFDLAFCLNHFCHACGVRLRRSLPRLLRQSRRPSGGCRLGAASAVELGLARLLPGLLLARVDGKSPVEI